MLHHGKRHIDHVEADAMIEACDLIVCRTRNCPLIGVQSAQAKPVHLVFNLCCVQCVPPRLQTRHGSVCFRGIHNDVTDRKRAGKGLGTFLELAGSPLAQQKRCNNKQAIRRRRERTQRHCKTLQIIKADFSLEADDYLCSSLVHK